jgi:hypothetical protein
MRVAAAVLLSGMLASVTVVATAASAQDDAGRARAERAFKQALADEQAGLYEKALGELVEARTAAQRETPQILFHLGVCHAHLGKVIAARDELRAAVERAGQQGLGNVAATARAQLDQVQGRVATLALARSAPYRTPSAVAVDGVDVTGKAAAPIEVDPGAHDVDVAFAEGAPVRLHVSVGEGEHRELSLAEAAPPAVLPPAPIPAPAPPSPSGASAPPVAPGPEAPSAGAPSSSGGRTLGWIALGGGVALVAGGAVLWGLRQHEIDTLGPICGDRRQQCPQSAQSHIDSGKLYDALGVTAFVAGGVAALTGGGLLLFGVSPSTTGARLTPVLTAHGGGLALGGTLW